MDYEIFHLKGMWSNFFKYLKSIHLSQFRGYILLKMHEIGLVNEKIDSDQWIYLKLDESNYKNEVVNFLKFDSQFLAKIESLLIL